MLRSIGAIVAGYIATVILTMITIPPVGLLIPASLNPENTSWVIANIAYGAVFAGIGGYVAALVAQKSEIKHATILAVIIAALGILTFLMSILYLEETGQPAWYYPALILTGTPATIFGGYLRAQQKSGQKREFAHG